MSDENQLDSTSFNKSYKVLKDTADWLSSQKEPDIDQLVPKVEKAMRAYSICKDRLTKVQETLGQYFEKDEPKNEAGLAGGDGMTRRVLQARPSPDGEEDDDIPF
jgi:exodeoxyribonuclease VII small subunit